MFVESHLGRVLCALWAKIDTAHTQATYSSLYHDALVFGISCRVGRLAGQDREGND